MTDVHATAKFVGGLLRAGAKVTWSEVKRHLATKIAQSGELGDRVLASLWLELEAVDLLPGELEGGEHGFCISMPESTVDVVDANSDPRGIVDGTLWLKVAQGRRIELQSLRDCEREKIDAWLERLTTEAVSKAESGC